MGRPIVDRLRAAGHDVSVQLRRDEAQQAADAEGLRWSASVAEAVAGAEVVIVVVLSDAQLREVCLAEDGAIAHMAPGSLLVSHTTCDPATVLAIGATASERGIGLLDAALSGGPHDIAAGRLTLWVGGDPALLDDARTLLEAYASPIMAVGALGNGQRVKLVNNALFVAQVGLAIDAVRLAGTLGIGEREVLAAVAEGSGASLGLSVVARSGSIEAIPSQLGALMAKDIEVVRDVAGRAGADLGILGAVLASDAITVKVLGEPGEQGEAS
jgi:3-hydroxyisobutyrate dehydrogenase-like beta-hydroxyacid dehydrogenase